jgi:6,7-dimethyl-8-ribityllumazine synthase
MSNLEASTDTHIAVVVSQFNKDISTKLLDKFIAHANTVNFPQKNIKIHHVPGVFEIPLIAKQLAMTDNIDAIVCLGSVIRGETIHFELIAHQLAQGIREISQEHLIPVIFGVLTVENIDQANARIHKASEFLDTALSMIEKNRSF